MTSFFEGKSFVITGGARGMGAAQAHALCGRGARVHICDVLDDLGHELADRLGSSAQYHSLDVASVEGWRTLAENVSQTGALFGMVNNAGILISGNLETSDADTFEQHFRVNQLGTYLGMKHMAPLMKKSGGGSIVNFSSTAGLRVRSGEIGYTATKWAVRGMTRAAADELAPFNIRANTICPGPIDTVMFKVDSEEEFQQYIKQVPLKRLGKVDEVANLVLFLLSDQSSYMTGADLVIDGGLTV